jgi:uncharacterized protein
MAAGIVLAAVMLVAALAAAQLSGPRFPALSGQIVDEAGLLSAEDRSQILADLRALEAKSTDQIVVVTLKSLDGYSVEDYGYRLGRHWGIGQAGKNNGVLLIIVPSERKVRIEVGRGLEPQLTDAMSRIIIDNALLPAFRRGDFAGGIKAAVVDIRDVLLGDAQAVQERSKRIAKRSSGIDPMSAVIILFWIGLVAFVLYAHYQSSRMPQGAAYRRSRYGPGRGNPGPVVIPGGWGGSGNWGGSGSGDSGGGWSGGGGDFGGGGSSGSW